MKYSGITIIIYKKDLHAENYTTLTNEIKETLNTHRDISGSWMERLNIVKMSSVANLIYGFGAILIKISASYFCACSHTNSKVHIEREKTQKSQSNIGGEARIWKTDARGIQDLI